MGLREDRGRADGFTAALDFDRFAFFPLFLLPAVFFFAEALVLEADFALERVVDFAFVFDVAFDFVVATALVFDLALLRVVVFDFATALALTFPREEDLTFDVLTEPRFVLALLVDFRLAVAEEDRPDFDFCFAFGFAAARVAVVLTALGRVSPRMVARAAASLATGTLKGLHET